MCTPSTALPATADDIADNPELGAGEKIRRLDRMAAVLDGGPGENAPAAAAMRQSLVATGMTAQHCHDVLRAFRQDAEKRRYRDWDELMEYCRYSASPVGRQLLDLHGESRETWPPSDALCSALQVLNHLQDCAEDYRRLDRVYLPTADLAAAGSEVAALTAAQSSPALRRVLDTLLDRTAALVDTARGLAPRVAAAGIALRMRGHHRAGGAAVAPPAPRRPAGRPGRARQIRFPRGVSARRSARDPAMSDAAFDTVPDELDDAALRQTIRDRVEAAGTSFYWAMRLLPRDRRNGMYAVYAWCREVDDIADGERPVAHKLAALAAWRDEIDALYAGRPRHLVARALHQPMLRYRLRREDFLAVIDGMEMDAREDIRAPDLATLDLYCARVASAVGHLSVHVFGDDQRSGASRRRFARPGIAADQHPARSRRGCTARTALSAARNPRPPRHPPRRPDGGAAPSGIAGGLPRGRGDRRSAFPRQRAGDGAMPAPGDAARGGDGRGLPRHPATAAARRVARPDHARQPVEAAEAMAGAAPRPGMSGDSTAGQVHVVGAGLAGLAAAVMLAGEGRRVRLYEASAHAGGRCRSYFDAELGCRIDNGNHLLLAGNRRALGYLDRIGARDTIEGPQRGGICLHRRGERPALDDAAESRRRAVVDFPPRATGPGHPRRRLSRSAGAALGRPVGDGRRGAGSQPAGCSAGCGNRSPSPR